MPNSVANISLATWSCSTSTETVLATIVSPLLVGFLFGFRVHGEDAHVAQDLSRAGARYILALAEITEDVHSVARIDQTRTAVSIWTFRLQTRKPSGILIAGPSISLASLAVKNRLAFIEPHAGKLLLDLLEVQYGSFGNLRLRPVFDPHVGARPTVR